MENLTRKFGKWRRRGGPAPGSPVDAAHTAAASTAVEHAAHAPGAAPASSSLPASASAPPAGARTPAPAPATSTATAGAVASAPSYPCPPTSGEAVRIRPASRASALAEGASSTAVTTSDATALRTIAPPTLAAEGGAAEAALIVQRYYAKPGSDDLLGGQSVHAYLASDLYLKHIQYAPRGLSAKGRKKARVLPGKLIDFKGCQEPILLKRLSDRKTIEDVNDAVSWKFYRASKQGVESRECPGLRIRCEVRDLKWPGGSEAGASATSTSDIVLLFEPQCEDRCRQWVAVLRSRIKPLALREREVLAISRAFPPRTTAFLDELESIYKKEEEEQERARGDVEEPSGDSPAASFVERSEAYMRRLERVSLEIDRFKQVGEGTANLRWAGDIPDAVARLLGGVTLIGPIVSVANMSLCIAKLVAQVREDREMLGDLCERVPRTAHRLSRTLFIILRTPCGSMPPEILRSTFDAIEDCWGVFNEAERYLLSKNRHQFCLTEHAKKMRAAADKLDRSRDLALRDESIAALFIGLEDARTTIANLGQVDVHQKRAVFAPPKPPHIVREAIPEYEAILQSLLFGGTTSLSDSRKAGEPDTIDTSIQGPQSVGDIHDAPVAAVNGDGGYGKTTCLLLLAHDQRIQDAFQYVLFIPFGPDIEDSAIVRVLADIAEEICPGQLAGKIQSLPPGPDQTSKAVRHLRRGLAGGKTLLILDNVWLRQAKLQWVNELAALVSGQKDSSVLLSTRSGRIAICADKERRFTVGRVADDNAARRIIERHAGLGNDAAKPEGIAGNYVSKRDEEEHDSVLSGMLRLCNGWHLALGMCGALVRLMDYRWAEIKKMFGPKLDYKLVTMPSDLLERDVQHPGLQAIVETNLKAAQLMLRETSWALSFSSEADKRAFESVDVRALYSRLSIFDAQREFPYYCIGPLFGLSDVGGEEIGRLFDKAGLTKTRGANGQRVIWLHDLQYAYADRLREEAGVPLATVHANFLRSCAKRFTVDGVSGSVLGCGSWSKVCDRTDATPGGENLATYICNNVVRHLVASDFDELGVLRLDVSQNDGGEPKVESEPLNLVCSYEWFRARGRKFRRAGVYRDFAAVLDAVCRDATKECDGREDAARRGVSCALQAILDVVQRIVDERFSERSDTGDGELASELFGRLAVLKFNLNLKVVAGDARQHALQITTRVQNSVENHARPPWLRPRSECYFSTERKDERCVLDFRASDTVSGVAYAQVGDESLLVTGGRDGTVRVHDPRLAGETVHAMTGHENWVTNVASANPGAGRAAGNGIVASCSRDGTVRLWSVEAGEGGEQQTLKNSNGEGLECLDLTPDAARVVAGGRGWGLGEEGKKRRAACEAAHGRALKEYCVHVWSRVGAEDGASAAAGADAYAPPVALSGGLWPESGHRRPVTAVQVSRCGERVVSASADGTVRIWRVPADAAAAARGAAGRPRVLDFGAKRGTDSVEALALAADAQTVYAGFFKRVGIAVIDCEAAEEVATLRSDRVESWVTCLALAERGDGGGSSGGTGAGGRLFAGHGNGTISEWDVQSRTCAGVYGDPRSRAGKVTCIAARFIGQGGTGGEMAARAEAARDALHGAGAGAGAGTHDSPDGDRAVCGAGEGEVEFAAGYVNEMVRVWRASSSAASDESSLQSLDSAGGREEAAAGVGGRVVERHVDTSRDCPCCLAASGDGRRLVSGSRNGVLCVWDTGSGACLAALRGHKSWIIAVDVSGDGKVIVSVDWGQTARVWALRGRRKWICQVEFKVRDGSALPKCVILTADGLHAVIGDYEGGIRVWDVKAGKLRGHLRSGHSEGIVSLAVVRDEGLLRSAGDSRAPSRLPGSARKTALRSKPETQLFASRDESGACFLWSLGDERALSCKEKVSKATDLGSVFSISSDVAPSPERWYESRHSTNHNYAFCADGHGHNRRYQLSTDAGSMLRLDVQGEDGAYVHLANATFDSRIDVVTVFTRQEDGDQRLFACCGLQDGTVALLEVMSSVS